MLQRASAEYQTCEMSRLQEALAYSKKLKLLLRVIYLDPAGDTNDVMWRCFRPTFFNSNNHDGLSKVRGKIPFTRHKLPFLAESVMRTARSLLLVFV